ncbi:Nin one binding Zn-ribbon like-domain-containing protein, partial [Scleroderma citrinum]
MVESSRRCKYLVLDSGPLLSLSPLRGLAEMYLTVPQVLDELKDKRAREHFEQLGISTGVQVNVRNPDAASLSQVIQLAKKTGDYSVLSHADICVLALTHTLHEQEKNIDKREQGQARCKNERSSTALPTPPIGASECDQENDQASHLGPSNTSQIQSPHESHSSSRTDDEGCSPSHDEAATGPVSPPSAPDESTDDSESLEGELPFDDPVPEDDGEGEWITPDNVELHKARALQLLPSDQKDRKGKHATADQPTAVGCMTADFAMQNVLLQMGLSLISTDGKRIQKVKSWVLRCHACFKICKDNSKQFCPSCGNPTLMRASVTVASPDAAADAPVMEVHLKKNYQYKLRGTKYSIPAPKPGSAKTGTGEGLILREDQIEYMRAKKRADGKREREEQRMVKGIFESGGKGSVAVGSWADPDWIPDILSGTGNKPSSARSGGMDGMPKIGYGRKNPNERRKK